MATIVDSIEDPSTLIALAQTCHALLLCAEAQLYKNVYVHSDRRFAGLATALERNPKRRLAIETFHATPMQDQWKFWEHMPGLVGTMKRLRNLRVESPLLRGWTVTDFYSKLPREMDVAKGVFTLTKPPRAWSDKTEEYRAMLMGHKKCVTRYMELFEVASGVRAPKGMEVGAFGCLTSREFCYPGAVMGFLR